MTLTRDKVRGPGRVNLTFTAPHAAQRIDLGYVARPQFEAFHARKKRWACIVAHRRAGKTVSCIMDLGSTPPLRTTKPDARFAYISPTYAHPKIKGRLYLEAVSPRLRFPQVEQRGVRPDEAYSLTAPVGGPWFGQLQPPARHLPRRRCVLDEYADMAPRAWPEVDPPRALADRQRPGGVHRHPRGTANDCRRVHRAPAGTDPDWPLPACCALSRNRHTARRKNWLTWPNMRTPLTQYAQEFRVFVRRRRGFSAPTSAAQLAAEQRRRPDASGSACHAIPSAGAYRVGHRHRATAAC